MLTMFVNKFYVSGGAVVQAQTTTVLGNMQSVVATITIIIIIASSTIYVNWLK